jgi:uncharacterized protein YfiM (DUF2279 family)
LKFNYYLAFLLYFTLTNISIVKADTIPFFASDSSFNKKRFVLATSTQVALYGGSLIGLNELWYKGYPRSSFHFFNDNKEWLQMDKVGHLYSSYNIGLSGIELLRWSGVSRKKAVWYGGLTGFVYLGTIEVLDGFSSQWGFSWGDFCANTTGSLLLIGEELAWKKQRITLKYSVHQSNYAQYRPDVLGSNFSEQFIKDYNGQTYWLSVNIASFLKKENKFPKWLNVALGYGAEGMTGGYKNPPLVDKSGNAVSFERYRQFYLSLDVDLRTIKTKYPFVNTLLTTFGIIKFPAPAIEFNKHGVQGHWIGF